jgi:hypothetical protein
MTVPNQPASVFRVRAHNTAADSENKIHDDKVAAAYGFRGGLVPGVTMYGYMVPAVLEQLGRVWLERGGIAVRLHAPCYEGDFVVARCDGSTVSAEQEDGTLYASGAVSLSDAAGEGSTHQSVAPLASHPLPELEQRPIASASTIQPGVPLGTIRATLDVDEPAAIPERLLRMANEILVRNFRMSPWIHAASEVRHHQLARCGEEITVNGLIEECFERKGRRFAVAKLQMLGDHEFGYCLLATVRHTFIYEM